MEQKIMTIFTRTPLHVGAGNSVGAVDSPIMRERHTGFPIIPATTLKGVFADEWTKIVKKQKKESGKEVEFYVGQRTEEGVWLFGADDSNAASSGAILFGEGKLLAFPVRSARGAFAWITCPTIIRRAIRDGVLSKEISIPDVDDEKALFNKNSAVNFNDRVVLEEYSFQHAGELPKDLGQKCADLLTNDPVWTEVAKRLVVVSDGMMSHFCLSACEVAQHVRIDDVTGTAAAGALFNKENVPSETMFYSVVSFVGEKSRSSSTLRTSAKAIEEFGKKVDECGNVFQFGGDGSTGLGYCTVELRELQNANDKKQGGE